MNKLAAAFIFLVVQLLVCAQGQDPVQPIINQTGQLPSTVTGAMSMKFAIVSQGAFSAPAFGNAVVTDGVVTSVQIVDPGVRYQSAPLVTFAGKGKGALVVATLTNGRVTSIEVTNGGSGYRTPPAVKIGSPIPVPTPVPVFTTLWSNDGTSVAGSEPATAVSLHVARGSFSAPLGLTALPNMQALPREIFAQTDARLRIWFRSSKGKYTQVVTDVPLQATFFADEAAYAESAGNSQGGLITTMQIADGAITAAKLAPGAVTSDVFPNGSIAGAKLASGAITADKLAAGAVTADVFPNGSITGAKLAPSTITADKLAPGAITVDSFSNGSIPGAKLVPGSVTSDRLADGAITPEKLGPGVVQSSLLENDAALTGAGFTRFQTISGGNWVAAESVGSPTGRTNHTTLGAGADLLIWGGTVGNTPSNQGGQYNLALNQWTTISTVNAPAARSEHTAIWTGAWMIVWGGASDAGITNTGGIYDPVGQLWRPTSTVNAPEERNGHTAIWTGSRMIIWGGANAGGTLASGSSFQPPANLTQSPPYGTWTALPAGPAARRGHSAVWTGLKMIIWGGLDPSGNPLADGSIFDPLVGANGTWTALPSAPGGFSARYGHSAVWTGDRMIIWGGANSDVSSGAGNLFATGAAYNPGTGLWTLLPTVDAPAPRREHAGVWNGSELLIIGGDGLNGTPLLTGGAYHPIRNVWRTLPSAPTSTESFGAVSQGGIFALFGAAGLFTLNPAPPIYLYGRF